MKLMYIDLRSLTLNKHNFYVVNKNVITLTPDKTSEFKKTNYFLRVKGYQVFIFINLLLKKYYKTYILDIHNLVSSLYVLF